MTELAQGARRNEHDFTSRRSAKNGKTKRKILMKISDGNWLVQPGLNLIQPVQVYEVEQQGNDMIVLCRVARSARTPGNWTFRSLPCAFLSAGRRDRRTHGALSGALNNGPHYPLNVVKDVKVEIHNGAEIAELKSGNLTARVTKGDFWSLDFLRNGVRITGSQLKTTATCRIRKPTATICSSAWISASADTVYGLGERFTALVRNGQTVDTWNETAAPAPNSRTKYPVLSD